MNSDAKNQVNEKAWMYLFAAWLIACIAMLGSLFFSEYMKFPPCVLCWYQRICMYPLVLILVGGLFPLDFKVLKYAFPLSAFGWIISVYHNLLFYKIIPESAAPCTQGVSCSTVYINWFGFINIPLLSFLAFSAILILFGVVHQLSKIGLESNE